MGNKEMAMQLNKHDPKKTPKCGEILETQGKHKQNKEVKENTMGEVLSLKTNVPKTRRSISQNF